jgi:hypothetical protein
MGEIMSLRQLEVAHGATVGLIRAIGQLKSLAELDASKVARKHQQSLAAQASRASEHLSADLTKVESAQKPILIAVRRSLRDARPTVCGQSARSYFELALAIARDMRMTLWLAAIVTGEDTSVEEKRFRERLPISKNELEQRWESVKEHVIERFGDLNTDWLDAMVGTEFDQAAAMRLPGGTSSRYGGSRDDTVVTVDLETNQISIEGDRNEYRVSPHLARITDKLVQDKLCGEPYTTGEHLRSLPGCRGKNISREIKKRLMVEVPPLADVIESNHCGYFLKR